MDMDMDRDENVKNIQVRFVTSLEEDKYKVPTTSISIPSTLTRFGLSSVLNTILKDADSDWESEPFDFLIHGELVRMSLDKFLIAKNISAERVLEIEYIKAVVPRTQEEPSVHDDWVSAIDGSNSGFILTGCYDGFGRVWKNAGNCTHVLEGHAGAISSVCNINTQSLESANYMHVATASKDRTLRLWKVDAGNTLGHPARVSAFKVLRGHSASVQCVTSKPSGNMVCSGSWDNTINLWETSESGADDDSVSIKKRKKKGETKESLTEGEAVSSIVGHTNCVSSVVWPEDDTIYSASWDHSIRIWDVETGKATWNMFCGKVLNTIDVGGKNSALVAAGASDTTLRIWDPRRPGALAPVYTFPSHGHTSWISSCKWHKKSSFHLASGSYDGKVMLWDLRTAWPVSVIESHSDKVLCVDWWRGDSIVSGGADSNLYTASGISV